MRHDSAQRRANTQIEVPEAHLREKELVSPLIVILVGCVSTALIAAATHGYDLDRRGQEANMPLTAAAHIVGVTLMAVICIMAAAGRELAVSILILFAGAVPFLGYVSTPRKKAPTV